MINKHYKCKHEERIITLCEDTASIKATVKATQKQINGNLETFRTHVMRGTRWRIGIVVLAASLLTSIVTGVFYYGKMVKTVEHHDQIIMTVIKEN